MFTNFLRISLFTLSIASLGVLFDSSSVNAQSIYNTQNVDTLFIKSNALDQSAGRGVEFDISEDLMDLANGYPLPDWLDEYNLNFRPTYVYDSDPDHPYYDDLDYFSDEMFKAYNRNQLVVTSNYANDNNRTATIWFTDDIQGFYGHFDCYKNSFCINTINENATIYSVNISLGKEFGQFGNRVEVTWMSRLNTNGNIIVSGSNTYNYYSQVEYIEYPSGYDGDEVITNPPHEADWIGVSIRGSVAEDVVQVEWYNDPNNPAPDEAKGMYLVLHNTNYDEIPPECSNNDIQNWRHNLDEIAIFNPVPCYGLWKLQSYYTYDEAGQDIIPNTDKTTIMFNIDGGSFYFDYIDVEYDEDGYITSPPISGISMTSCISFTTGIPWLEIDFGGCFENVQKFIGIAKENNIHTSRQFNAITLPAHSSCGSFKKIDGFLYISEENNWVCPQLTEVLRMPVTYFAVFLLYIITIFGWFKFMASRT